MKTIYMKARKVKDRPTTEQLTELLNKGESYRSIGAMYGVSDNAVRKWYKLAGEQAPKIHGLSEYVKDALTGETVRKEHNELVGVKNHFVDRMNAATYEIENGKLHMLDIFEYERLKQTMSIRAIARMYNCRHSTLIRKFSSKIHTDKLYS